MGRKIKEERYNLRGAQREKEMALPHSPSESASLRGLGICYISMRCCLFHNGWWSFLLYLSSSQLQPLSSPVGAPDKFKFSPKQPTQRVTQFTMTWESLAFGNRSVRSHWLFVICSRHVLNVSLVPRQSPDLRVRWQHQPHKIYFGSKSSSRIMLTHEFWNRALGNPEGW